MSDVSTIVQDGAALVVRSNEELPEKLAVMREAQKVYATFTQEQVDKIFYEAAMAANKARIPLAEMAVEETGMGLVEDKVIKNHYASEYIYNAYKDTKTCGVIEDDPVFGIKKIAEPIGIIGAVIPTTNPTSTAIFKCLIALKTRNAIMISPHPRAKACTAEAARIVNDAAVAAGAPEHLIVALENASEIAAEITAAGSVFVGAWSPESAGDYASGTNHTLPTSGWARSCSGVNMDSFMRKMTLQELSREGLESLAPTIVNMAQAEGLDAHARAVTLRIEGK